MSKQNNEWLYSLYQRMIIFIIPMIYPWLYSDWDISLWICMYCLKLYLLYLIIIVLRATWKISLLLLTVLPSWNKVITYLLSKSIKSKMTQLRISAHCLNIERGRYNKPKIPREERFCKFCTEVETEEHFLISCHKYKVKRTTFFQSYVLDLKDSHNS
jgi:hypothetical protein